MVFDDVERVAVDASVDDLNRRASEAQNVKAERQRLERWQADYDEIVVRLQTKLDGLQDIHTKIAENEEPVRLYEKEGRWRKRMRWAAYICCPLTLLLSGVWLLHLPPRGEISSLFFNIPSLIFATSEVFLLIYASRWKGLVRDSTQRSRAETLISERNWLQKRADELKAQLEQLEAIRPSGSSKVVGQAQADSA